MSTAATRRALVEAIEDNIASMTYHVKENNIESARIKVELKQSKKMITTPMIDTISFNNFNGYAQVEEYELHVVQLELYVKEEKFLDIYTKL